MTEKLTVHESDISSDDIFDDGFSTPEDEVTTVDTEADTEVSEPTADSDFEDNVEEEKEADIATEEPTEKKDDSEFNIDELLAKFEEKNSELEKEKKRRADTQSDRQRQINKHNKVIEDLIAKGRISEAEAQAYMSQNDDVDSLNNISKRLERDKELLGAMFDGDIDDPINAFSTLGLYDAGIRDELMSLPENKTSAYIIRKGTELKPLADELAKHDGSIIKALQAKLDNTDMQKVAKAAYEKGMSEATAKMTEKYKDYINPSKSRPMLDSSTRQDVKDDTPDESTW